MRVRQSSLKVWTACSLQGHLDESVVQSARVSGKQVFGTVIHYCLDRYNNGTPIEQCIVLFRQLWDDPESITEPPNFWHKYTTFGGLRLKGAELLKDYDSKHKWEKRQILASEHRFLVPFGDHELEGTVDSIELKKSGNGHKTLYVVDFKTASSKPSFVELRLNIQFTTYIFATLQPEFWIGNGPGFPGLPNGEQLYESLKNVQRKGIWYHLMLNQELDAGGRDDGDFMRLYRLVTEIQRAKDAQVFVPNIGDACLYCSHTAHCGIEIPDRDQLKLEVL